MTRRIHKLSIEATETGVNLDVEGVPEGIHIEYELIPEVVLAILEEGYSFSSAETSATPTA